MSGPHLTVNEREAFLAASHIGVLSVESDNDRPPLTVPVWYGYEPGGDLSFFTGTQGRTARKSRLIEKAGVVSFCVQQEETPYKYVTIEGTVVQVNKPPSAEQMFAVVRRYLPEEQARAMVTAELEHPDSQLVLYTIRPDRWLTSDFSDDRA